MKPLIVSPCPECGNSDVSRFVRIDGGWWHGEDAVQCLECAHVRVITDDEEE